MLAIDRSLTPTKLQRALDRFWDVSGQKIRLLGRAWNPRQGTPVFTVAGRYTSRGWTEWTQGFQFGSALLQYAATGETEALAAGRTGTLRDMAAHVSAIGVHDHGFNNVSTYGVLRQLALAGDYAADAGEIGWCELALKASGAVQAARWTDLPDDLGYIYSFNGPHSLFADTIRSLRSLALAHQLGHALMGERDRKISLLRRLCQHAETTARYTVYHGKGRDAYDVRGRVAHESIFNVNDGSYRCPSSQQGYSPFTTWTRGLAWIICGYAEQLEFLATRSADEFGGGAEKRRVLGFCLEAARATADFYVENTPTDGVPYWDTGAPGLPKLGRYLDRAADPFNDHEPVDSSAAAIAAQGFIRLGRYLASAGRRSEAGRYTGTGLTIARTLFDEPYLSTGPKHQGLLLHSVYHRPNGWDHVPKGRKVPCGEACMWGDYHARELAYLIQRMAAGKDYVFFGERKSRAAE
ncbi:MAG TPA: glycosyl hydrolase [Opitutaceae bacterium]|nr:glycosyl hydrolase [Opitutaceae bacterium]